MMASTLICQNKVDSSKTTVMICLLFLLVISSFPLIQSTIDLNLPELQYLADRLHPEECRRLVASLHFKSYEQPNALDQAEGKVSKDIPCIRLLLHWNSAPGEGKGETHEAVQHRLRQIGRTDLADWLGKTVFHELGEEMEESINDPFKDLASSTEKEKQVNEPTIAPPIDNNWDPMEWIAFDTICWVLLVGLCVLTFFILAKVVCMLAVKKKQKKRKFEDKSYNELSNEEDMDTSESEDQFDVRAHTRPATKLHKATQKYKS